VRWIAQDNPPAASAFRRALDDAADRIVRYPQLGRSRPDIASEPVRFLVLTGFPYVVIYDPTHAPPRIVSIQHGARDLVTALGDL
jgi:toxin ParE1/3/4